MSYSYLKNVFPKFEDSTKVYNSSLYTQIDNCESSIPVPESIVNENQYPIKIQEQQNDIVLPQTKLLESFNAETELAPINILNNKKSSDNLKFYNSPYVPIYNKNLVEKFEDTNSKLDCDLYIKHINDCNKCRSIVLKQFGIETDRIKNEEIMEIISYIIFGLFILLLIDSLKTSK
jgi:hypothetical protein|uniref:Uncharacterized protein n=1 Tax=viral metagenome TaxID=1070528 RepID=A0A6C0ALE8_9ZZZZ